MSDLKVTFPQPCDQSWDAMAPSGCNRHCATCDKVIHDLAALTFEEAEALLAREDKACVRAEIGPGGVVRLKPSRRSTGRRMVAAAGASLALATAACQTVPETTEPRYRITGKFGWKGWYYTAELTSADGRTWPKRREPGTGRYIFDNLVPGTYVLTTQGTCGEREVVDTITIVDASVEVTKSAPEPNSECIIVGVMVPSDASRGRG